MDTSTKYPFNKRNIKNKKEVDKVLNENFYPLSESKLNIVKEGAKEGAYRRLDR